jgi:hypothetical protein
VTPNARTNAVADMPSPHGGACIDGTLRMHGPQWQCTVHLQIDLELMSPEAGQEADQALSCRMQLRSESAAVSRGGCSVPQMAARARG